MNNKKSLLQDSLQELENIKNESLELAKEQLINESADLLEKKSAALFEKLISEGEEEIDVETKSKKSSEEKEDDDDSKEELETEPSEEDDEEEGEEEDDEEGEEDDEDDISFDDEEEDDEFMSVKVDEKVLRESKYDINKKDLFQALDKKNISDAKLKDLNHMKKLIDTVLDKEFDTVADNPETLAKEYMKKKGVLAEAKSDYNKEVDAYKFFIVDLKKKKAVSGWEFQSDAKDALSDYDKDPNFKVVSERTLSSMGIKNPKEDFKNPKKINENINMKNNRKEVIKDLRDISFNKLVEAYYNMDESDSFIVKEGYNQPMEEEYYEEGILDEFEDYGDDEIEIEDDPEFMSRMSGKKFKPSSRELQSMRPEKEVEYDPYADVRKGSEYSDEEEMDEELMYEVEMEGAMYDEEYSDAEINEMLGQMDLDEEVPSSEQGSAYRQQQKYKDDFKGRMATKHHEEIYDLDEDMFAEEVPSSERGSAYDAQEKHRHFKGDIHSYHTNELEEAFSEMTMEELEEMSKMLEDDGSYMPEENVMSEEEEIETILSSMEGDEELEESSAIPSQTKRSVGNLGGGSVQGRPERRSNMISEDEMEEVQSLQEKIKRLEKEKTTLQEGFVNKVKSLENKVYDVTISALKAGFVNKFLLEHPLRENEKTEIVYRFANAQTKEQIKETYISLTNEFAKGQTVKDGSMLNESVQSKLGKVHRTDNAIVREKNLISENDESNRFKQLLNYNFGRK